MPVGNGTTSSNSYASADDEDAVKSIATTLMNPVDSADASVTDRRSLRLYSKKHRVYIFREFVLQTYATYLSPGDTILDIAGGKGDLSWILHNVDSMNSIVIDPRRTINHIDKSVDYLRRHPNECIKRSIPNQEAYQPIAALMPILKNKKYHVESPSHIRVFVDDELVRALLDVVNKTANCYEHWEAYWISAAQRTMNFITPSGKNDFSLERVDTSENNIDSAQRALQIILRAKLIVGYHPDQATDACFVLAQILHVPVCVVPCCVFPSEFPQRRFYDAETETDVPVEKYDDLIQYLRQQYPELKTATLNFPGTMTARRTVLYTQPEDLETANKKGNGTCN
jgi:hypothetical protein